MSDTTFSGDTTIGGNFIAGDQHIHHHGGPPPEPQKKRVFISHAHQDDTDFARSLYEALKDEFDVWLDLEKMPGRGDPFPDDLRAALTQAHRVILIGGPEYLESEWCRFEYEFALKECKPVTPVWRLGDAPGAAFPAFVIDRKLTYIDMRPARKEAEATDHLRRVLRDDDGQIGDLLLTPLVPPDHYLPRPDLIRQVREALRPDSALPVTVAGKGAIGSLYAAGGLGKSMLAAIFIRDCDTRRGFPDGIVWAEAGPNATVEGLRTAIGGAFGIPADALQGAAGEAAYRAALKDRDALIVLDDVWSQAVVEGCFVEGPHLRWLITTRLEKLGRDLGLPEGNRVEVDKLTETEGLTLLRTRLPAGESPDEAVLKDIHALLDGHTGALELVAYRLGRGDDATETLARLRNPGELFEVLKKDVDSVNREDNLLRSLTVSYDALTEEGQRRFRALGAFAPDGSFDRAAAAAVWGDAQESAASWSAGLTRVATWARM